MKVWIISDSANDSGVESIVGVCSSEIQAKLALADYVCSSEIQSKLALYLDIKEFDLIEE